MNVGECERNRLTKLQSALVLAASDMRQAAAAAEALIHESDGNLARALETAMAVCYMRAFTSSDLQLPLEYVPTVWPDGQIHADLKRLRDKVYAHTDKASGRTTSMQTTGTDGEIVSLAWREEWLPFPRQERPAVLEFFGRQEQRLLTAAASIHVELETQEAGE